MQLLRATYDNFGSSFSNVCGIILIILKHWVPGHVQIPIHNGFIHRIPSVVTLVVFKIKLGTTLLYNLHVHVVFSARTLSDICTFVITVMLPYPGLTAGVFNESSYRATWYGRTYSPIQSTAIPSTPRACMFSTVVMLPPLMLIRLSSVTLREGVVSA